jgi:hypothetical protein
VEGVSHLVMAIEDLFAVVRDNQVAAQIGLLFPCKIVEQ